MEHYKNLSLEDIEGEVWKDISEYEGVFQISNLGRIKCLPKTYKTGKDYKLIFVCKEKIKKGMFSSNSGYYQITLNHNHKVKHHYIHRLIAITFIPNPNNKGYINHKNGIKTDNRIENLEWVTMSENHKHAYKIGLKKPSYPMLGRTGTRSKSSIPIIQLTKENKYIAEHISAAEVERTHNYLAGNLSSACIDINKSAYGYKWMFKTDYLERLQATSI